MNQPIEPIQAIEREVTDIQPIYGEDEVATAQELIVTPEEWQEVVIRHFPNLVPVVEACIANTAR